MMTVGYRTPAVDERKLDDLLKLVAHENTLWALNALRHGKGLPRSAEMAGILYCPDRASQDVILLDAASLLDQGVGSCGSIAAFEVGLLRARLVFDEKVPLPVAIGRYRVRLLRRPGTDSISYWHAVVRTPTGLDDPTRRLRQVCATPEYA